MSNERPGGARRVKAVESGAGHSGLLLPGVDVTFKLDGDDTNGAIAMVEHRFDVGSLVPPHMHTREDEYSVVLEGSMGFRSGDDEVVLGPGGYVTKPRGEIHAMWNAGSTRARMLEVISPAGFEQFFRELVKKNASGPVGPRELAELAERYGLPDVADPDWIGDVIARYELTPPLGP